MRPPAFANLSFTGEPDSSALLAAQEMPATSAIAYAAWTVRPRPALNINAVSASARPAKER